MLIKYIRDFFNVNSLCHNEDGTQSRGVPIGVVVATGPNSIGFAICNPCDRFNKERGKHIASERAAKVHLDNMMDKVPSYCVMDKNQEFVPLSNVVQEEIKLMGERAKKYFK